MFRVTVCHQVFILGYFICRHIYSSCKAHYRNEQALEMLCVCTVQYECVRAFLLLLVFRSAHSLHIYVL